MYICIYLFIIKITNGLLTNITLQFDTLFSAIGAGVVCAYNINIIITYYMVQLELSICNDGKYIQRYLLLNNI